MNPMDLNRGIDKAVHPVVEEIKKSYKKVGKSEEIPQVGSIAANGDHAIGDTSTRPRSCARRSRMPLRSRVSSSPRRPASPRLRRRRRPATPTACLEAAWATVASPMLVGDGVGPHNNSTFSPGGSAAKFGSDRPRRQRSAGATFQRISAFRRLR
jgi:hypothetical protein